MWSRFWKWITGRTSWEKRVKLARELAMPCPVCGAPAEMGFVVKIRLHWLLKLGPFQKWERQFYCGRPIAEGDDHRDCVWGEMGNGESHRDPVEAAILWNIACAELYKSFYKPQTCITGELSE